MKGGGGSKIQDPMKALPFQGLRTPAFSLQRAQPAFVPSNVFAGGASGGSDNAFVRRTRAGFGPGDADPFGEDVSRVVGPASPSPQSQEGSGPFELTRTDNVVPSGELGVLSALRGLRPQISGLSQNLSALATESRDRLEGLLGQTRAGFGNLTQARVEAIDRNRSRTLGNLREAFGKRNVLGASFAQGEIRRADQEFAQLESEARAESAVQELELSRAIINDISNLDAQTFSLLSEGMQQQLLTINQEAQVLGQRASRELEELRVAGGILTGHQQAASNIAIAEAQLAAQEAQASGEFFGSLVGLGISAAGLF